MADINKRGASDCEDGEGGERGERGERGKRGKRGHRGHDGHDGKDGHDGATGATGPVNLDCNCVVEGPLGGEGTESDPFTIVAPVQNIVYRPEDPLGSHNNVYVTWEEAYAAIERVRDRGRIMLEFDSRYVASTASPNALIPPSTNGTGDSFAFAAGIVTLTDAAALFTQDMVGRSIRIVQAADPLNNGTFTILTVNLAGTAVTYANPDGVAEPFSGRWALGWNMAGVHWTGPSTFTDAGLPNRVEIMDGAYFVMRGPEPDSFAENLCFYGNILQIIFNGRFPGPGPNQGGTGITPFGGYGADHWQGLSWNGWATQLINTDPLAAPMIVVSPERGFTVLLMATAFGNTIGAGNGVALAPVLDLNGQYVLLEAGGNIANNALMDSAGGGFFDIQVLDDQACGGVVGNEGVEDGVLPTYDFPAVDPTLTTLGWKPLHRDRMLLRSSAGLLPFFFGFPVQPVTSPTVPFAPSFPYDAAYNELVVARTVAGPDVDVNAPRAFPAKGERVTIKNISAAGNVRFVPQPGSDDAVEAGTETVVPGQSKTWHADGFGTWLHTSST